MGYFDVLSSLLKPRGTYWPIALMQKMVINTDSRTSSITTILVIFWMQVSNTEITLTGNFIRLCKKQMTFSVQIERY